jgi:hypothetical protein
MFKKIFIFVLLLAVGTIPCVADSENSAFAGKRITIQHEKGKTPEDWYKTTFDISKKLVESGEIISSELVQEGDKAGLIRFLVQSDSFSAARNERALVLDSVGDAFRKQGLPITYHYVSFPENKIFGDKRIGYIVNRFESCYYEPFLTNALISQGAIIVKENENPDVTLTIGVDTCMSGWELENDVEKKYKGESTYITSVNREAGVPLKVVQKTSPSGLGSNMMRSGSSLQLNNATSGTTGLAIAGVGLALDLFERSLSNKNTEVQNIDLKYRMAIDLVRYHITLEGKGQKKVTFYHTYTGTTQHDMYGAIANDTFIYPMQMLYLNLKNWMRDSNALEAGLQTHQKEPDLLKALKILHEN